MRPPRQHRALVRPHVVTGGRAYPTRNTLDLVTLVTTIGDRLVGLTPEERRVVELCRGGFLSVAEIAAHLALPVSVARVLLSDLMDSGDIAIHAPDLPEQLPKAQLLQKVLDGLRAQL